LLRRKHIVDHRITMWPANLKQGSELVLNNSTNIRRGELLICLFQYLYMFDL